MMRLCPTYMMDPIFVYNKIESMENEASRYELKFVKFQYFTRQIELVKVVSCPVTAGGSKTRLYFLEINHHTLHTGGIRGYFVFANKLVTPEEEGRQPLELLMYSVPRSPYFTTMDTTGEEATLIDSLDLVSPNILKIRLREKVPNTSG